MSGSQIADEVDAGILEAALATGAGSFSVVLRKKVDGVFSYYPISCVRTKKKSWDAMAMVQRSYDVLLVSPLSKTPAKGDHVAIGVALADAIAVDKWSRVQNVETINPAGVDLLHRLYLEQ